MYVAWFIGAIATPPPLHCVLRNSSPPRHAKIQLNRGPILRAIQIRMMTRELSSGNGENRDTGVLRSGFGASRPSPDGPAMVGSRPNTRHPPGPRRRVLVPLKGGRSDRLPTLSNNAGRRASRRSFSRRLIDNMLALMLHDATLRSPSSVGQNCWLAFGILSIMRYPIWVSSR